MTFKVASQRQTVVKKCRLVCIVHYHKHTFALKFARLYFAIEDDKFKMEDDVLTIEDGSGGNPPPPNGGESQAAGQISRVTLKIPAFWSDFPEIWFAQVEAQFAVHKITSDNTRFSSVVGNMESKVLSQVSDAVLNPPDQDRYGNLKKLIIERFSDSAQRKMQKMLSGIDLGDKKPSFLFNELKQLGGANVSNEVLKTVWLQRLPPQVTAILASIEGDVKHLASVADAILDTGAISSVSQVSVKQPTSSAPFSSTASSSNSSLEYQIAQLTRRIDQLQNSRRPSNRSSSSKRQRTPSRSRQSTLKKTTCWYHREYGTKATKCTAPCDFSSSSSKN